ncbi:kelch repeat-containing protein, partial [Hyalangium minutum]|uniref:kelch repeat-containing protein n=1 Tax=Hyalangium minutum TaxID=394096 RepID=UPI001F0A147F
MPSALKTGLGVIAKLVMTSALLCLACREELQGWNEDPPHEGRTAQALQATAGGTWVATKLMVNARDFHSGTLLSDGKVLVIGGVGPSGELTRAEVYDPDMGAWSLTNPMIMNRVCHTATLLPLSKVLVAGGVGLSGELPRAEVYDPDTGAWSLTGPLSTARCGHTAILLSSGKVLIAGGWNSSGALASAELYDPDTGEWSPTGSMATARQYLTATLLPSSRVLVAGGSGLSGALASAEVYDPGTGQWNPTGPMATARARHTATSLLGGKVLVAGGSGPSGELANTEVYDPDREEWSPSGPMATARARHTATPLPGGKVLVTGGLGPTSELDVGGLASAEVYDPATGEWSLTGPMDTGRMHHTATLLRSGEVLAVGGYNWPDGRLASAEVYNPAALVVTSPANHSTTKNHRPIYCGTAKAESTVTLFVDGREVGTTKANTSGEWCHQQPVNLAEGIHTVRAWVMDVGGSTGADSNTNIFTVDITPPAVPELLTPADDSTTKENRPIYGGTAEAGCTVTVFVDGSEVGTTKANASREWSHQQPVNLADGSHTVRARATDTGDNTGLDSKTHSFLVDATSPEKPLVRVPDVFNTQNPSLAGVAEARSLVTVWLDGTEVGTLTADEVGNWSVRVHRLKQPEQPERSRSSGVAREAGGRGGAPP